MTKNFESKNAHSVFNLNILSPRGKYYRKPSVHVMKSYFLVYSFCMLVNPVMYA